MEHYAELEARNVPPDLSQDCGIARRCKLFVGTELERAWWYWTALFVWPPMERRVMRTSEQGWTSIRKLYQEQYAKQIAKLWEIF